ncbi:MAG: NADH-quinone oxidoreductase subunit N [Burkholderiales bacterium]|jgi:NADH-quinone oxidoreductase subunit N|nr:NADH-quinone oxidoreductase subunit N [Burkholderiales bacterium]
MTRFSGIPEVVLLIGLLLVLLLPVLKIGKTPSPGKEGRGAFGLTQLSLGVALLALLIQSGLNAASTPTHINELVFLHPLTTLFQAGILLATFIALLYARGTLKSDHLWKPELFALLLCSVIGALTVVSANHFLPLFLGVEMMSLPLYAMIALKPDQRATEAAMKYFFLGALSSAILLYALSLAYGTSGTLTALLSANANSSHGINLANLAYLFLIAAIAFKLSLVPFHGWAPDVYQGAPTFLTFFISTVPKLAGVMLLFRFSFGEVSSSVLTLLSLLSMIVGAVAAIIQTDIKRMLAYSTIGHMGYLLLGMIAQDTMGYTASFVYIFAYALTGLAAFGVLLLAGGANQPPETLDDLAGFSKKFPALAWVMAAAMLSYAGVPPFIGFFTKFAVIESAWNAGTFVLSLVSVVAILTSVIAAFYYLRVIALMFFTAKSIAVSPISDEARGGSWVAYGVLAVNGAMLLVLGVMSSGVFDGFAAIVESALRVP